MVRWRGIAGRDHPESRHRHRRQPLRPRVVDPLPRVAFRPSAPSAIGHPRESLGAAVNRGQKLLLMSERQNATEVEIVNTRSVSAQLFEVEVTFPSPRPDFWQRLQ